MASEWIPVSERLPEPETSCLITTTYGDVELAFRFTGKTWVCECEDFWTTQVTAWMPLPEPYKADKWGDFPYVGENIEQGNGLP